MVLSKSSQAVIVAHQKGYRVDKDGNVIYQGRQLKLTLQKGYYRFSFRGIVNGIKNRHSIPVHRLQAYQKYGSSLFENNIQTRHLNSISTDNSEENISIGTSSENQQDKPPHLRRERAIHASYHNRKFTNEQVGDILKDRSNGYTYSQLITKYQTSKGTLSYLFNNSLYAQMK